jgi:hypothetical protein
MDRTTSHLLVPVLAVLLQACAAKPPMQDGRLDCEGLTPVTGTGLGGVCVQKSVTGSFSKAMLGGIEYGFTPVGTSSSSTLVGKPAGTRYPVGPEQKKELAEQAEQAFIEALDVLGMQAATEPESGVLLVRGQILDVLQEVPQDPESGAKYLFDAIARATIVVELYDSESDELLLRAFDHRETEPFAADTQAADAPSQMAAIAGLWQAVLTESVNQLPD